MDRVKLVSWVGTLGLSILPLGHLDAQLLPEAGQVAPSSEARPLRPRSALQNGVELYMKGDYENAEGFLRAAEAGKAQLSPTEQGRLDEYLKKNGEAMQARFQALEQLAKADELVQTGHAQEAEPLIKALKSSKHLTAKERQQVNGLNDRLKQSTTRRWGGLVPRTGVLVSDRAEPAATQKVDPDAMLAEGRKAFERQDYAQAELWANEAEKAGAHAIFPWSDTPAKLLRDIQAARAKSSPAVASGTSTDAKAAKPAVAEGSDKKAARARDLLKQASQAAEAGDTVNARRLVQEAEDQKANIAWYEDVTPRKVMDQITRVEQASAKVAAAPSKPEGATASTKAPSAADAKAMVKEARQALDDGKLDQAEDMAKRARLVTSARWGLFEDNPDKVMADVAKARESSNSDRASQLLGEARKRLEQGQYDEAEKLTYQAEQLRSSYPIWHRGERHDRLRAEIASKRKATTKPNLPPLLDPVAKKPEDRKGLFAAATANAKSSTGAAAAPKAEVPLAPPQFRNSPPPAAEVAKVDPQKQQAVKMLADARASLNRGDYLQALTLAGQVKMMNLQFTAGEDSPEAIVAAVSALQKSKEARDNPHVADGNRRKAMQMVADARLYQKNGQLLEALEAAKEAKQCGAVFGPNDDLPETVLADLRKDCEGQIEKYSAAAQTLAKHGRHQDAEKYWRYVYQVATAYQVDTKDIAVQLAQAQQVAAMKSGTGQVVRTPATNLPDVASDASPQGKELLAQAEKELKKGEIAAARKMAEAIYTGPFNMKNEAKDLLARIDDAEYKQTVKRAETLYDQGVRAYLRKDYQVSASYFQSLDLKLLDERKRAHAQEILSSKDMQPHSFVQASMPSDDKTPPGKTRVTDQPGTQPAETKPSLLSEVQARQQIALQKLREQQLQSQREANKLAAAGDYKGAIQVLQNALTALKDSEIDDDQANAMRRQLEQRVKQFTTMSEQVAFAELQRDKLNLSSKVAERLQLAEESKKAQVADLLKQHNAFMKEGKYKEAAAVAMKAKEIDPDNPAAEIAVFKADVLRNLASEDQIKNIKQNGFSAAMRSISESSAPMEGDVNYPTKSEWETKTAKRQGKKFLHVKEQTPQDKEVANKLNTIVSVDFRNKPLVEVIDDLRVMTGVNIVPDRQYIDMDGISLEQPITMTLDGVPLKTALKLITHNARLTYVIQDGVVQVTTPLGEKGKQVRVIYPVADLIVVTDQGLTPPDPAGKLVGQNRGLGQDASPGSAAGTWTKSSPGEMGSQASGGAAQMAAQQHKQPGQTIESVLIKLITDTIEPAAWDQMGGSGHIDYYPLGMTLVVSQTPDIQEQVQLLLDRLRELQQLQVTVEVRFITLSENFYERIGVDFDMQFNDNQTRFARQVVTGAFAPPDQPNEPSHLDNVIVGLTPSGNFTSDLDIPINASSFGLSALPASFAGFPGQPGANGGIDLGMAFLSSIEVFLFIEAAQGDIRNNILTAPKITLFNGQTATFTSSVVQFLTLEVIPVRDPLTGLVTFFPVNSPVPSTTSLTVSAIVSADRRYVTLSLAPTITRILNSSRVFEPVAGIQLQQPDIEVLTIATAVSVPDGGTILLGGLKQMSEQRREFGPPILSKIPYINRLYRNQSFGREARSLLVMVTPRIIIPEEEEEKLGQTFAF